MTLFLPLLLGIALHSNGVSAQERPSADIQARQEMTFWESIRDSKNPELFQAYLEQYPNGQFARIARIRIAELVGTSRPERNNPLEKPKADASANRPAESSSRGANNNVGETVTAIPRRY